MDNQTIAFVSGLGAIGISILGGGIEVKEFRLPPLSAFSRVMAAIFGTILLAGSGGMLDRWIRPKTSEPPQKTVSLDPVKPTAPTSPAILPNSSANQSIQRPPMPTQNVIAPATMPSKQISAPKAEETLGKEVVLIDNLSSSQVYERVKVYIRGKYVGTIAVDRLGKTDSVKVMVSGGDSYRLTGVTGVDENGALKEYERTGEGIFRSDLAESYYVNLEENGDFYLKR